MSTSVTASEYAGRQKLLLIDLIVSLFCVLFGAVYELFSHGVYSYPMLYAFVFPLALGVLPLALIPVLSAPYPNRTVRNLLHAGIAALTVGSLITGVLEIYGTTNPLTPVYWILGGALTALGAALYFGSVFKKRKA